MNAVVCVPAPGAIRLRYPLVGPRDQQCGPLLQQHLLRQVQISRGLKGMVHLAPREPHVASSAGTARSRTARREAAARRAWRREGGAVQLILRCEARREGRVQIAVAAPCCRG